MSTTDQTARAAQDADEQVNGVPTGEDRVAIPGMSQEGETLQEGRNQAGEPEIRHTQHGDISGVPDSSRAGRTTSYDVADFPPLSSKLEDWRFTPIKRLRGLDDAALQGPAPAVSVSGDDAVQITSVGRDDSRVGSAGIPEDRVSANAWSSFREATVISVPRDAQVAEPVIVTLTGESEEPAAQHIVVDAGANSKALVVLRHVGTAVLAQNIEFSVADGANLTVVSLQEWTDDSVHASSQQAKLGRDATFKHVLVSLGGDLVRVTPSTRFTAPGGDVEMYGLTFVDDGQHLECRLFVDHSVPRCRSRVNYKSALQGENAHGVWVGDVLIRAEAEGTDTYELNRNLILNDGPRMDSVPNLEIETGLIAGAGHASTTGQLDDEHLYYLMSRGIPEDQARRLVVRGFLFEIIQQVGVEALEEQLRASLEDELARTES